MTGKDFDFALMKYGKGRWYSSPPDFMTHILYNMRQQLTFQLDPLKLTREPPRIYLDIADNPQVGATALLHEGEYFIAINHGTFHVLSDLFWRQLADSRILRHVGNPDSEAMDPGDMTDYFASFQDLTTLGHSGNYHLRQPNDPFRSDIGRVLMHCAVSFLLEHELSHILFGHLAYIANNGTAIPKLDRQTMELQADMTATLRAGLVVYRGSTTDTLFSMLANFDEVTRLALFYYAVSTMVRVHGYQGYWEDTTGVKNHPSNPIRQNIIANYVHTLAEKAGVTVAVEELWQKLLLSLVETEKAYAYLTGTTLNLRPFNKKNLWRNPIHKAVHENWNPLREMLLPYTYKSVLPWDKWSTPDLWMNEPLEE